MKLLALNFWQQQKKFFPMNGISSVAVCSLNVNGIGSKQKRDRIKAHCETFNAQILVLIDTRLSESTARELENEWDNRLWYHSYAVQSGGGISRGISIGIEKKTPSQ